MTEEEIGFGEISDVYRNERRSKVLTKLPPHFRQRADEHLRKLRDEHCAATQIPNNPGAMMLWDQVSKVDKRLRLIYEIRERKITLAALDRMMGAQPPEYMDRSEKTLYDKLVETLRDFRDGSVTEEGACPQPEITLARVKEAVSAPQIKMHVPEPPQPQEELAVVHVLEDIPEFAGLDGDYELKKDEMATIPSCFANVLSSKGLVRIVPG